MLPEEKLWSAVIATYIRDYFCVKIKKVKKTKERAILEQSENLYYKGKIWHETEGCKGVCSMANINHKALVRAMKGLKGRKNLWKGLCI